MINKRITTPAQDGFRMPGEFEPHEGTIMIWPVRPGSWGHGAVPAQHAFSEIAVQIARQEQLYMLAGEKNLRAACCGLWQALLMVSGRDAAEADRTKQMVQGAGRQSRAENMCDWNRDPRQLEELAALDQFEALTLQEMQEQLGRCNLHVMAMDSDDSWARDVGPTFVRNDAGIVRGIDWKFNAWGGAFDGAYMDWERDDRVAGSFCEQMNYEVYNAHEFVLEGGSIHSDGEGTILVTSACLLSEGRNPDLTQEQITQKLCEMLGAQKVIWLPCGIYNDETNEHVDNVCAFVAPGEVVLAWSDDETDPQYKMSAKSLAVLEQERDAKGRRFQVHKLLIPQKPVCIETEDLDGLAAAPGEDVRELGERLAASYVNYYICNAGVIVPQFGDENDSRAVEMLAELYPQQRIYPVQTRDIIVGGGNIHCITQQIPLGSRGV